MNQTAPGAAPVVDREKERARRRARLRAGVLRQTLRWHWISAAICLIGMLLFAVTGVTLNHAAAITAQPRTTERAATLPDDLRAQLHAAEAEAGPLPSAVRGWLRTTLGARTPDTAVEWSPGEAYVALPGPGRDAWVSIDTQTGETLYERTDRGWVAYFNDLHKGRNTGPAWGAFIDIFAAGCIVFCLTGLVLLQLHSHARRSTWPLVALGLLAPCALAVFLIH